MLAAAGAGAASLALGSTLLGAKAGQAKAKAAAAVAAPKGVPNILIIICDQLAQRAVSAYGNRQVRTAAIDSLAASGARFSKSYVQCPLCMPVRASIFTGRWPHETTVLSNYGPGCGHVPADMTRVGELFTSAGYEARYYGKTHDGGALRGFQIEKEMEVPDAQKVPGTDFAPALPGAQKDRYASLKCAEFLGGPHDRPFIAVASFINPHDICGWIGPLTGGPRKEGPEPKFDAHDADLPPLPDNFEIKDLADRPTPVQYLCCTHRRLAQAAHWSETQYRRYIAAYYEYVKMADAEVGRVLAALNVSAVGSNTMVVLLADHGDGMACHRGTTKDATFYEETTRVPLIFSGAGITGAGSLIEPPLVSMMDLAPTLLDVAGIAKPAEMYGRSLRPWLRGESPKDDREFVVSEWYTEAGVGGVVPARMVRSQRYKYTRYIETTGESRGEELYDLAKDPGETHTLIKDPACAGVLAQHRKYLEGHVKATNDPFFTLPGRNFTPKHALGYPNHGKRA